MYSSLLALSVLPFWLIVFFTSIKTWWQKRSSVKIVVQAGYWTATAFSGVFIVSFILFAFNG